MRRFHPKKSRELLENLLVVSSIVRRVSSVSNVRIVYCMKQKKKCNFTVKTRLKEKNVRNISRRWFTIKGLYLSLDAFIPF